jgi:mannose-6-phosphate isomerase-like protein (cupin superfamily)
MNQVFLIIFFLCSFAVKSQKEYVLNTDALEAGNTNITSKQLFYDSLSTSFCIIIKNEVKAHKHLHHSEHVVVQSGEGIMKMNDKEFRIKSGDVIFIPKNTAHSVIVKGKKPLKVLSIQSPFFNGDDRVMIE